MSTQNTWKAGVTAAKTSGRLITVLCKAGCGVCAKAKPVLTGHELHDASDLAGITVAVVDYREKGAPVMAMQAGGIDRNGNHAAGTPTVCAYKVGKNGGVTKIGKGIVWRPDALTVDGLMAFAKSRLGVILALLVGVFCLAGCRSGVTPQASSRMVTIIIDGSTNCSNTVHFSTEGGATVKPAVDVSVPAEAAGAATGVKAPSPDAVKGMVDILKAKVPKTEPAPVPPAE